MTSVNQNCYQGRFAPKCPNQGQSIYLTTLISAINPLKQSQKKWQSSILRFALYRFHQFYHLLSLSVTYCHSLSFVVTRCTTYCHSLLLVVARCITNMSFYNRLIQSRKFATRYFLKIDLHKFQKCKRENLQFQQDL